MASYRETDVLERIFNACATDALVKFTEDDHETAEQIDFDYATDDKGRVTFIFRAEDH